MEQNIFNVTRHRISILDPVPPANPAKLLNTVTRSLSEEGNYQRKLWQEGVIRESAKEGEIAGSYEGAPEYREGNTLSAEAFNEAAKRSYLTRLEIDTSKQMAALREKYKMDPEAYLSASKKYIDGVVSGMKENSQTAAAAELMKARLQLEQQASGYAVSKNYMAYKSQEIEVETDELIHTLSTNSYREAGGIFSKDDNIKGMALERFAVSKQALDNALHTTLPDGTPVYSPKAVAEYQNAFHTEFYTRSVQDYVSQNDISDKELAAIMDGSFKVNIPGGVGEINILNEVGAEVYSKKIQQWTFNKIREQNSMVEKAKALQEKQTRELQKINGAKLIGEMLSGVPVTLDMIYEQLDTGTIDPSDAKSAIKIATDPNTGSDDQYIVSDLKTRIAMGEDVEDDIRNMSPYMKGTTFISLMEQNAKNKSGQIDEAENWIVKQVLKPDEFGFPDPNSQKQAADIQTAYRQMISDGMDKSLAYEKAQVMVEILKSNNEGKYSRISRFAIPDGIDSFDIPKTLDEILKAHEEGRLSYEETQAELQKLKRMKE